MKDVVLKVVSVENIESHTLSARGQMYHFSATKISRFCSVSVKLNCEHVHHQHFLFQEKRNEKWIRGRNASAILRSKSPKITEI